MPELTLGHSPDSDDLVMWWPLTGIDRAEPEIDTAGFTFRATAADIQALNRRAFERADLDITALSAAAYPLVADRYAITASGGSFGEGYGPKLVVRSDERAAAASQEPTRDRLRRIAGARPARVAVPGRNTTAFMVLTLMLGRDAFEPVELPFERIAPAVAADEFDAGLLIHEAQLTFESLGLEAAADIGLWWTGATRLPLPLGLNTVRRDLDDRFGAGTRASVARVLAASIRHAVAHSEQSRAFLLSRSADRPEWRDPGLLDRYLSMYVSGLTLDMGDRGRSALGRLYADACRAGLIPNVPPLDVL